MEKYFDLTVSDWVLAVATLLGPILAIQAQKMVESSRERRKRKFLVFEQLMSTRMTRLSKEHVQAINMIELAFYGARIFGKNIRSRKEENVLKAWNDYLDHLGQNVQNAGEAVVALWHDKGNDLYFNLLRTMSLEAGFSFNQNNLKKNIYLPIVYDIEAKREADYKDALLSLIRGNHAINMNVVGFPYEQGNANTNEVAGQIIEKALKEGGLRISIDERK